MKNGHTNDEARRTFWTNEMDTAFSFMEQMKEYPVKECGEPLVSLRDAAASAGVTIHCSQTKLARTFDRLFLLREGLIPTFLEIARELNRMGWTLKVEDGFRTRDMQKSLALQDYTLDAILKKVLWETGGTVPAPDLMFRRLTALIATCPKIGTHMSGSAMDISVLRSDDLSDIDRGGPYLEMSERTPMHSPFVSAEGRHNRAAISHILQHHGFMAYPYEFWHYSKGDAYAEHLSGSGKTARYGPVDFTAGAGTVAPIPDPTRSFHSMQDIQRYIDTAMERLKQAEKAT